MKQWLRYLSRRYTKPNAPSRSATSTIRAGSASPSSTTIPFASIDSARGYYRRSANFISEVLRLSPKADQPVDFMAELEELRRRLGEPTRKGN
jgi:hypothetical protein